ncbi:hypothetical protein IAD21_00956 [Abditibacteriota bacterium]|nr:hypothetical protein IAD21_00956 [Abditibacteriota bacterium]
MPHDIDSWLALFLKIAAYWFVAYIVCWGIAMEHGPFWGANCALLIFFMCFGIEWLWKKWKARK